jgi:serine/threonine protein kinase
VFTERNYDATKVDVWSLAIIFCCMTLRRFPWKCPKPTDSSFKLFLTQPSDDELASSLYPGHPKPQSKSEPASRAPSGHTEHYHHHHNQSTGTAASEPVPAVQQADSNDASEARKSPTSNTNIDTASTTTATTYPQSANQQPTVIKGPWRLLRLLPRETRHIVSRMLEVDPVRRATMEEVTSDQWVTKTPFCRQEIGGLVYCAETHNHHLATGDDGAEVRIAKVPAHKRESLADVAAQGGVVVPVGVALGGGNV